MQKAKKVSLFVMILALMFVATANQKSNASLQAIAITCPPDVRIGVMLSCELTGLTVGSNYVVNFAHSDGNVSRVVTASSTTEYARWTPTTADSDGIVPVHVGDATAAGAETGGTDDTALVNLVNPNQDIPSAFFQNLLSSVLLIGIFVLLMGSFFVYKRYKR